MQVGDENRKEMIVTRKGGGGSFVLIYQKNFSHN